MNFIEYCLGFAVSNTKVPWEFRYLHPEPKPTHLCLLNRIVRTDNLKMMALSIWALPCGQCSRERRCKFLNPRSLGVGQKEAIFAAGPLLPRDQIYITKGKGAFGSPLKRTKRCPLLLFPRQWSPFTPSFAWKSLAFFGTFCWLVLQRLSGLLELNFCFVNSKPFFPLSL